MSTIKKLTELGIAHAPSWLPSNVHYETIMGSFSYGVSSDTSDMDICAWCIPTKEEVFPHLRGEILGFGQQKHRFQQYQEHGLKDTASDKKYDLTCYNIVDFFHLVMKNNPNMIDSLFTRDSCVLHITSIGQMVKDKRHIFLHRGAWHTFKGYAYQQMHKLSKKERDNPKRQADIDKYGYDTKFAYHLVRLLAEIEQILVEGDLDLMRNSEQLKSIRRGDWTEEQLKRHFSDKERQLEELYNKSSLPWGPDETKIKTLLLDCLEEHYGSLDKCIVQPDQISQALRQVVEAVDKVRHVIE